MLTPGFELKQNDEFLIVSIFVPYAKVSEVDVHFEDNDFIFYSKPYYLRLNLPGKVLFTEKPAVDFDVDKKTLTVKAPKAEKGQHFEDLDLITKLLAQKKNKVPAAPLIEVIDGAEVAEDDELDWNIEQIPPNDFKFSLNGGQCGFANMYAYHVFKLVEEVAEIFDIKDPQGKTLSLRTEEKLKAESDNFSEDHYIGDLYQDEDIQQVLKYQPEWNALYDKLQLESCTPDDFIKFTPEEKKRLTRFPNKEYLLSKTETKVAYLGLVDIIYAFAYNKRTTEGENTVESAWTINKLSSTLSWLETFSSIPEVAQACIRRSLCYPLFRHFELSVTILEDVRKIFLLGRKYVIKCLLEIHELFCLSDPRYILNDLYITDYCVWMQSKRCSSNKLIPIANAIEKVLLTKGDIGLNLVDIESFAAVAWMAHNSNSENINSNKDESTPYTKYLSRTIPKDNGDLCQNFRKLSVANSSSRCSIADDSNSSSSNSLSQYESCSSCTSDSNDSSSNTFDSETSVNSNDELDEISYDDSYDESGTSSESDEEEADTSESSDEDALSQLLRKANVERLR